MSAIYYKTSDSITPLVTIHPLESNGADNLSTPRQVVDVEFLDKTFLTPMDAFVVNDDVTNRFVTGFSFGVVGGIYEDTYTVAAPGSTVVGGQTHIPVADITSTAIPYNFVAGSNVVVTSTTPGNYLVTWIVDGLPSISMNDNIQVKHIAYNDNVNTIGSVNRRYTVHSVAPNTPLEGQTTVVTIMEDEYPSSSFPIIGTNTDSTFVILVPQSMVFGYVQYTVPTPATSLMLIGKGAPLFNNITSWGNAMQANMIHMMEHFAHTAEPISPMDGQMWFDMNAYGPAMQLRYNSDWYGVVAEGLPVQGDINMNDFKVANLASPNTTYPYIVSSTGWGNNDQEAMNLGTSDTLYIAKTGGYSTNPTVRSGTMSGSLNMTGPAGINFKATGSGSLTFEATSTGGIVVDGSGSVTVATGNVVAIAGNMRVGSGTNQVVTQNNAGAAPTTTFTTSTTGNNVIQLNNNMLTGLSNAVNLTDAVSLQFADGRYVNVTGDTMSGTLAMSSSANITLADGDIILGTGSNTVSILRNGIAASSIVFNTAGATTTTGNNVINLGSNMLTGLSAPILASDATNKAYVDSYVSGIIWLRPVLDPSLVNDTLSAPPVDDGFDEYHRTYIVAGTGTGAWAGFNGHLMAYDGATWQSVLGRAVLVGDRFGVFCSPDNDDPLSTLPGGGLTGHSGKIVEVTGVSPYTYTTYTPAEPDAFSVIGVLGSTPYQSPHMGHSYTFRGQYGVGSYGVDFGWIVFSGPQMIVDGAGLRYDANVLNTDGNVLSLYNLATTGFVVRTAVDTVESRAIAGTAGNIVVTNGAGVTSPGPSINLAAITQGAVGTSFVKIALDGFGRVTNNLAVSSADITTTLGYTPVNKAGDSLTAGDLTLFQDPSSAMHATTKQYVDAGDEVGYEYFMTSTELDTLGAITPGYGYVTASYTSVPLTGGTGTGATADIVVTASAIDTLNNLIGGTLYTDGTYNAVPLIGGTGTGSTADITVASGAVTVVTVVNPGIGYTVADTLSASNVDLGGTGTGFSIDVATVSGAVTSVTIVDRGVGYTATDALSASNVDLGGSGAGFSIDVATTREQTTYTLTNFAYIVGSHKLMVYVNGVKEIAPPNGNYTETSISVFTFTPGVLTTGNKIEAYRI